MRKNIVVIFGAITLLSGCGGVSDEDKKIAQGACVDLIKDQFKVITYDKEHAPRVFDTYKKKGKIVVKVGYKLVEYQGDLEPYSTRLCVVDIQKGTVTSPSPLNNSEWLE
jgi:hypothetical protein